MSFQALLAQWIARWTSNPKVVGSSPTQGTFYVCSKTTFIKVSFLSRLITGKRGNCSHIDKDNSQIIF